MKRGDRFLHRHWLSSTLSIEEIRKTRPEEKALLCQVTKVTADRVYWRGVYQQEDREELGSATYFPAGQEAEYVLKHLTDTDRREKEAAV